MAVKTSNSIMFSEHKKIIKIEEWYLATYKSKGVTIDDLGWTLDVQPMDKINKYLWNYEKTIYSLGDPDITTPVIIGVYSDSGDGRTSYFHIKYSPVANPQDKDLTETPSKYIGTYTDFTEMDSERARDYLWSQFMGNDGKNGDNGIGIDRFEIKYAVSNDGVNYPTNESDWGTTIPIVPPDYYLWTRTDTYYTGGTPEKSTSYSVSKNGKDGTNGDNGKTSYLHIKYSDDGGISFTDPTEQYPVIGEAPGEYIGQYTSFDKVDSLLPTDYKWALIKGVDGAGIKNANVDYYIDTQGSTVPEGVNWVPDFPSGLKDGEYLWVRTTLNYKDETVPPTISYSVNKNGSNGTNGDPGGDGQTSYIHIKYSDDGGLTFTPPNLPDYPDEGEYPGKYIGQYSDFISTDSLKPEDYKWALIKGKDGTNGNDGIGVSSAVVTYAKSDQGTTHPILGWSETFPTDLKNGEYLWTKTEIVYTDPNMDPSISYSVSRNGDDGSTAYIHIKYSNDGGISFTPANPKYPEPGEAPGEWIGQYSDFIEKDSNSPLDYKWSLLKGQDGDPGIGVKQVINYYTITPEAVLPPVVEWTEIPGTMTPQNRYLWNYEKIIYTDEGHVEETDPIIIGVYGDSEDNSVTFTVYSRDGFVFREGVEEIKLNIAAFQGNDSITTAKFTWEYWDAEKVNDDGSKGNYEIIINETTDKQIVVSAGSKYSFAHMKCTMHYNNKIYETYVDLLTENTYYSANIKFFGGNNIFNVQFPYIIAYVDLYRNNKLEETIRTNQYYVGPTTIMGDVIYTNLEGTFDNGQLMYFIYEDNTRSNDQISTLPWKATLGKYVAADKQWKVDKTENKYIYKNDLDVASVSNILVISKNDVNKSKDIVFRIYINKKDENGFPIIDNKTYVSQANALVFDLNDPIISPSVPDNASFGQIWLDTSVTPYVLKIYTKMEDGNGSWEYFSQTSGQMVYTERPVSYTKGDIWILAEGEICKGYKAGSMLKATKSSLQFSENDWVSANEENEATLNDIRQYFSFSADYGLKIGQKDEKFYMRITSKELGIYDNSNPDLPDQQVVKISDKRASINNMEVKGGAEFNCNVTFNNEIKFGNFIWKLEQDGSLSLAIVN